MKKLVVITALAALTLTGCSGGMSAPGKEVDGMSSMAEKTIELTDGRTLTCVVWKYGYAGGMSCDWDGAKP